LVQEVISLPMHSELTLDQVEHITLKIKEFLV
jgi:dTDP-4-amino-4,6-dideoxygalactose transaminase